MLLLGKNLFLGVFFLVGFVSVYSLDVLDVSRTCFLTSSFLLLCLFLFLIHFSVWDIRTNDSLFKSLLLLLRIFCPAAVGLLLFGFYGGDGEGSLGHVGWRDSTGEKEASKDVDSVSRFFGDTKAVVEEFL